MTQPLSRVYSILLQFISCFAQPVHVLYSQACVYLVHVFLFSLVLFTCGLGMRFYSHVLFHMVLSLLSAWFLPVIV